MQGKVIQFKANISNFKVQKGKVNIQLTADTQDIVLDQLNDVSKGQVFVNLEASQTEMVQQHEN